ncbi:uncharacterized protein METZ01_LOCUS290903 [marine metagenome]|uniref:Uncharacterized protein n=1 Tax=marine metagenome TaxID=408172 RepID=A0A382LMV6_9ZZZZ
MLLLQGGLRILVFYHVLIQRSVLKLNIWLKRLVDEKKSPII